MPHGYKKTKIGDHLYCRRSNHRHSHLMDEPSPGSCPAANLEAGSDWIHANDPGFDYAYSWGTQNGDTALSDAPASLRQVFAASN